MSDSPLVEFEDVDFAYTDVPVLEQVSFSVGNREVVAVVGPNGSGKTTLLRLMLGLEQPSRGSIRILGRSPRDARARVGYMPQHTRYDPLFPVTAQAVVLMGCVGGWFGRYSRSDRRAARQALDDVGLAGSANTPFAALSGGQRQRVLMARALMSNPELLLLDEPTANIDAPTERKLRDILAKCSQRMTVLIVSHDLGFVSDIVEKVVCVNRRVHLHPTSALAGGAIEDLYGEPVAAVQHGRHYHGGDGGASS